MSYKRYEITYDLIIDPETGATEFGIQEYYATYEEFKDALAALKASDDTYNITTFDYGEME